MPKLPALASDRWVRLLYVNVLSCPRPRPVTRPVTRPIGMGLSQVELAIILSRTIVH